VVRLAGEDLGPPEELFQQGDPRDRRKQRFCASILRSGSQLAHAFELSASAAIEGDHVRAVRCLSLCPRGCLTGAPAYTWSLWHHPLRMEGVAPSAGPVAIPDRGIALDPLKGDRHWPSSLYLERTGGAD
jgi:hypothetical protein